MKYNVRYRFITIPGKITGEIRIQVNDRGAEYTYNGDNSKTTSINLFPYISISITRPSETDETGKRIRGILNPNDSLSMTKYTLPIFIRELTAIRNDMNIPDMYIYTGNRLDVNPEVAEKSRRVFMIGNTTLELTPVVIEQNDTRVEGIKVKFNNEQSSFGLTVNETDALLSNLNHLSPDTTAILMYTNFIQKGVTRADISEPSVNTPHNTSFNHPYVDIAPKDFV